MLRRRLTSFVIGVVLLAALGLASVPITLAGSDAICATKPTECGNLTINISGYIAGNAGADASQASQVLVCPHEPGSQTDSCSGKFYVGLATSRTVVVYASPVNPAGVTICITTSLGSKCGTTGVQQEASIKPGGRATATVTFNPTNGKTVTVSKGGTGSGTITSDKGGINCGSFCTWMYADSTLVILTATPTGGSTFAGWSDGGTCQGQDATCHILTGSNITTQAIFNSPTPPPTSPPTATPTKTPTPTATPHPSAGAPTPTPGHSAGASGKPSGAPGTPVPGGPSLDPNASPGAAASDQPTTDPNAAPTPTPFKFSTDDPNVTEPPLHPQGIPAPGIGDPASASGSGPPVLLLGLVAVLGVLVFGGVFWWARRRSSAS